MGDVDLKESVDFIIKETGKEKITIVGFSQGTTLSFYSLAEHSEFYKDKVNLFVALAPVITLNHTSEELLVYLAHNYYFQLMLEELGYLEWFPKQSIT